MDTVAVLMRKAPYGSVYTAEGFRTLMGIAVFEMDISTVFVSVIDFDNTLSFLPAFDVGYFLAQFGYHTDKYQLLFFGKLEEVRQVSHSHPEMIPFLPLKMAVFAERNETVMVALNPLELGRYINDPHLQVQLARWHSDIRAMLV